MESPNPESSAGAKRKRSPVDDGRQAPPSIHPPGTITQINYLAKARSDKLRMIEGDAEMFGDVLAMIDDYEGVLQRHESLAANLGAKLVGPLLLKSFEKLFDGPIKVIQTSFGLEQSPASWLDVVTFARTNPSEFVLSENVPGVKSCRFWVKGGQVEVSEDDYRLIMSGGPERMIPTQPIAEDESAELGTLNILETRLAMLIKKADAVASKARQLNYHLKGRKAAVLGRKAGEQPSAAEPTPRNFSPQPFSPVNTRSPAPGPPNGETLKIQAQLLEQFAAGERRQSIQLSRPKAARISTSDAAPIHSFVSHDDRRLSHPIISSDDGSEGQYRVLMASKIEKLARGDPIYPPCDRCRRLKFDCTKHLTACSACTKKHAKCSWKDIKDGEMNHLPNLPIMQHSQALSTTGSETGTSSGIANGYVVSVSNQELHMDPALRNSLPSAPLVHSLGQGNMAMVNREKERGERVENEHAILTQIASAAAAAGVR